MLKYKNLYDAATGRGRIMKQGDIVCITMDGGGAVIVPMADFVQAHKWAQSKPPSGNMLTDRARFLDQFPALVSRPNSQQVTRGNERHVERIARSMRQAGHDLSEWQVPPEMRDPQYWIPKAPTSKTHGDQEV